MKVSLLFLLPRYVHPGTTQQRYDYLETHGHVHDEERPTQKMSLYKTHLQINIKRNFNKQSTGVVYKLTSIP